MQELRKSLWATSATTGGHSMTWMYFLQYEEGKLRMGLTYWDPCDAINDATVHSLEHCKDNHNTPLNMSKPRCLSCSWESTKQASTVKTRRLSTHCKVPVALSSKGCNAVRSEQSKDTDLSQFKALVYDWWPETCWVRWSIRSSSCGYSLRK